MNSNFRRAKRVVATWRGGGISAVKQVIKLAGQKRRESAKYREWLLVHGSLTETERSEIRGSIEGVERHPLISVVLPVYNVEEKWLRACIESVIGQIYPNWELCIADDWSSSKHIRPVLAEYAANDKRIKLVFRDVNGHISAASNSALDLATGEFVVLLDHDDELSEDALYYVAKEINDHPDTEMIYSDEDLIDEEGVRSEPKFKPDFARDLFYSLNLVTHLSAYKSEVAKQLGGFRVGFEGSQDYDLALRVIENIPETAIRHIPRVLYHWRAIKTSVAHSGDAKPYAYEKAREALREHFVRTGVAAKVIPAAENLNRVIYELPSAQPTVSLIVFGDGDVTHKYADDIKAATSYPPIRIVPTVVKNNISPALNAAAREGAGEVICFVDSRLRPLSPDWLNELVSFAARPEIGAVGAKIMSASGLVRHAGLVIGTDELVAPASKDLLPDSPGYFFRSGLIGNFSAISVACMVVRRAAFESVGGFDAGAFPNNYFDADLCLRLGRAGLRTVFTPYAQLIERDAKIPVDLHNSGSLDERRSFEQKWVAHLKRDPFYNPNLSRRSADFSIDI